MKTEGMNELELLLSDIIEYLFLKDITSLSQTRDLHEKLYRIAVKRQQREVNNAL